MKLKQFLSAILIVSGILRAQVGIGIRAPEGVLHMKTQTKSIQGESIQAALVLPTPGKADNVKNIQGGKPAPGSLVFDQSKQCLRYFYLVNADDPRSGRWSECSGKDTIDKMMSHQALKAGKGNFKKGDFLIHRTCGRDYIYQVIESEKTKRKWLDRNIGADRMAEHKNDRSARGSLYQWGRESDGHECWGSQTTDIRSNHDRAGHDKFIVVNPNKDYTYKWQSIPEISLWKMPKKLNNPCPYGFHVPSRKEWEEELKDFTSDDEAFNSPLKLVRWGFRNSLGEHSDWTYAYWSADFDYMVLDGDKNQPTVRLFYPPQARTIDGMSVRCIADN